MFQGLLNIDGLFHFVVGVSRNSANKLTSMYQITYVLFMHSLMFYDVTSDDVVELVTTLVR